MMTIGAIGFLQPWVLAALAALPAIWWLLRLTPPSPQLVVFPPTRLSKDLKTTEETPAHSPWWLTALRMLLAALIILALARPVLNPERQSFAGSGPLLLVIDNGWASAAHWAERREAIEAAIDRAARDGRTVVLAPTAPGQPVSDPLSPDQARERIGGLSPEPYAPDRAALAATLEKELGGKTDYSVLWLSDGLDYGEGEAFAARPCQACRRRPAASPCFAPSKDDAALALGQAAGEGGELAARVLSGAEGPRSGVVKALTGRGEPLGEAAYAIGQSAREATAQFDLPLEIRNQVARIEIAGERSAGAVYLLDARSQWHRVGIVSGESREAAQPLLSPLYYVQRALSPYADVIAPSEGNVANAIHDLVEQKVSTIVLADIGKLVAGTQEELEAWLKSGGVLIRFAGPRLEQGGDELLPVALAPRRPLARRLALLEHAAAARAVRGEESVPRPCRARRREGEPPGSRRSHRGERGGGVGDACRRHAARHRREAGPRLHRAVPRDGELRLVESAAVGTVRGDASPRGDARSKPGRSSTPAETPRVEASPAAAVATPRPARCRRSRPSTASAS